MPTIDELFKPEVKSGYSLDELFSDKSEGKKIGIDQLFVEDNKQILEPSFGLFGGMSNLYSKIDKAQQPKTPLDEAFGGLSNAEIISGKKKEDAVVVQKNIRDPLAITKEQLKEVWQEELGVSQENRDKLKWLLGDPDNTLLGKTNNYLFGTGSKVIDGAIRTGTSVGIIASGLAGDFVNTLYTVTGNDPSGAGERLTRDLNIGLMETMGRSAGFKAVPKKEGILKSEKTGKEFSDIIEYAKENTEQRKEVIQNVERVLNEEIKVIKENNDIIIGDSFEPGNVAKRTQILDEIKSNNEKISEVIPKIKIEIPKAEVPKIEIPVEGVPKIEIPKTEIPQDVGIQLKELDVASMTKVKDAAIKFLKEENIKRDPTKPVSLQIQELWLSGEYNVEYLIRKIAEDNNLTQHEFTSLIYPSGRISGQKLNRLSQIAKEWKKYVDPSDALFETSRGNWYDNVQRLSNIWKGLLVSRLSTAVRNFETQTMRLTIEPLTKSLDLAIQQVIKPFVDPVQFQKNTVSPISSLQAVVNNFKQWKPSEFKKFKELTNQILEFFPTEKERLFSRYASDVKNNPRIKIEKEGWFSKILTKAESAVDIVNIVNKTQEFITRRAVFLARLDEAVKANGKFYKNKTLEQLIKDKETTLIRRSDLNVAIDKALDVTFSKDFNLTGGIYDRFATRFIQTINSAPFILTNIIPFPRFLMNSIKFHAEYNPFGILRYVNPTELKKLSRGDTSGISKAFVGLGLISAAIALRDKEYAGEKWYEFKVGERTIDARPFNPFAAYLFMADVIKRYNNGTLRGLNVKDIATVFTGIRGTTGLAAVDGIIDLFTNPKIDLREENWVKSGYVTASKAIGETLAGFLTPFQNITDAIAQFYPEMAKVRDTSGSEFTGSLQRRIYPIGMATVTSPTSYIIDKNGIPRAAPLIKQDPLLTQVTGLGFTAPKNPAEKELDRLGFQSRDIFRPTNVPEVDRAYKDQLSYFIGKHFSDYIQTPFYQSQSEAMKSYITKEYLASAKENSKAILQKDPSLVPYLLLLKINELDTDKRKVLNEIIGFDYYKTLSNELKKNSK